MTTAKTTAQWLDNVLLNPEEMKRWLMRQYIGERGAAERIINLAARAVQLDQNKMSKTLAMIATDEALHALYVAALIKSRGWELPLVEQVEDRYWKEILPNCESPDELMAAGYHAEQMRLVRIKALIEHYGTPTDIRHVFKMIYSDEVNHVRWFDNMAGEASKAKVEPFHKAGMKALSLGF